MKFLDENDTVVFWTKNHGIVLVWGPENRRYIPDFLVKLSDGSSFLEEVKGWIRDENEFYLKCAVARNYAKCHEMTFRVLFKNDLEIV
jgi:hypothetical protein